MDLGRELVACALRERTLRPFLEGGISHEWLNDPEDPSRSAVFPDQDMAAWRSLVAYWDKHGKVMTTDLFRRSYPEDAYKLPKTDYDPDELLEVFGTERRRMLAELSSVKLAELVTAGDFEGAAEFMANASRIIRNTHQSKSIVVNWDSPDYDVEGRINRTLIHGVPTGIEDFDTQEGFLGFQPGNLVCYLGRAKAGKTSFALLSAIEAWRLGMRVLFVTFEIVAGKSPEEPGISDRLDSFGAEVDMLKYMQGRFKDDKVAAEKLRKFRKEKAHRDDFRIVQPTSRYTVTDLKSDIEKFEPDVVYIDGFYFMTDYQTGKSGANWEGHDNLANDLKSVAMDHMIPVVITHQVREKQLTGKRGAGIDDGAMMGGTAIIMFADLVLGVDADDEGRVRTLSCTRSRLHWLDTVHGTWDWATCKFVRQDNPFDQEAFGYQTGGSDD